jgi:hypothetical protein
LHIEPIAAQSLNVEKRNLLLFRCRVEEVASHNRRTRSLSRHSKGVKKSGPPHLPPVNSAAKDGVRRHAQYDESPHGHDDSVSAARIRAAGRLTSTGSYSRRKQHCSQSPRSEHPCRLVKSLLPHMPELFAWDRENPFCLRGPHKIPHTHQKQKRRDIARRS